MNKVVVPPHTHTKFKCDLRDDEVQGGVMHVGGMHVKVKVIVHEKTQKQESQSAVGAPHEH